MRTHLFIIALLLTTLAHSQTTGKLLVLSNVAGQVLVDGTAIGDAEPNKPIVQEVAIGDHLVQLAFTSNGKAEVKNEMVTVEAGKQKAVQFTIALPAFMGSPLSGSSPDTVKVAEVNFELAGSLAVAFWQVEHQGEPYPHPTFYYAFEQGDVVVIDVITKNVKGVNSIEVTTYPGNVTKYSNRAFSQLNGQTFSVDERCILQIQLATNHPLVTKGIMRIRRIPASAATARFSTDVLWRQVVDTTYTEQVEEYVIQSDTTIVAPVDQVAKVSSRNALNGNANSTVVDFTLPDGTVAWSYYIGVGKEGTAAYGAARELFIAKVSKPLLMAAGSNPLGLLAIGGMNYFSSIQGGDNVKYWFIPDWQNVQQFKTGQRFQLIKQGDVVSDASRMLSPLSGQLFLGLSNDNMIEPIDVTVKVTAVVVHSKMGTRTVMVPLVQMQKQAYTSNY